MVKGLIKHTSFPENILPPVERPLQLVSRSQWDTSDADQSALRSFPYRLRAVTVVQTGTERCNTTESCTKLLLEMQVIILLCNLYPISSKILHSWLVTLLLWYGSNSRVQLGHVICTYICCLHGLTLVS